MYKTDKKKKTVLSISLYLFRLSTHGFHENEKNDEDARM